MIYIGTIIEITVICQFLYSVKADRGGWGSSPYVPYYIQTDEGPERYFQYQTLNGQYRKEKILRDGTVVGAEGWVDSLGYLRINNYIADRKGYRIISRSKKLYVGDEKSREDVPKHQKHLEKKADITKTYNDYSCFWIGLKCID